MDSMDVQAVEPKRLGALVAVAGASLALALVMVVGLDPIGDLTSWLGISTYWAQKIFDTLTSWQAYLISALMMSIGMGWATLTVKALIKTWIATLGKAAARKFAVAY